MTVSIGMATYNGENYVAEQIKSILKEHPAIKVLFFQKVMKNPLGML